MTLASDLARGPAAGAAPHALARYRSEFPIFRDRVYLNTCSLGALGERARRKVAEFLDLWQSRGASAWYDVWWAGLTDLRARYARLVGAAPAEIALAPSISVAVSAVAESLDYARRPRVVVTSLDFPTIAYQWLAKRARGVELVGGPGIVFAYIKEELARRLEPTIAGWFGHRDQFAFDPRRLAFHDDARRFELGTPALAAVYAQLGGLEYIEEIGVPAIRAVTAALTEDLIARAAARGFRPKVATDAAARSAIVMLPATDPAAAVRHLADGGIIADARPGHVRFSPFFYNQQDDHVTALERLATHCGH